MSELEFTSDRNITVGYNSRATKHPTQHALQKTEVNRGHLLSAAPDTKLPGDAGDSALRWESVLLEFENKLSNRGFGDMVRMMLRNPHTNINTNAESEPSTTTPKTYLLKD